MLYFLVCVLCLLTIADVYHCASYVYCCSHEAVLAPICIVAVLLNTVVRTVESTGHGSYARITRLLLLVSGMLWPVFVDL